MTLVPDLPRRGCDDWPRTLNPARGCLNPSVPVTRRERVVHVALRNSYEKQPGLEAGLRSLATAYAEVDWLALHQAGGDVPGTVLRLCREVRPTLVFAQIQGAGSGLTGAVVREMRRLADPAAVIVQWDGDQMWEPDAPEYEWFIDFGREADASLASNAHHQDAYRALGVRRPGHLHIGIDDRWGLRPPTPGTPPVVFLAAAYPTIAIYDRRRAIARAFARRYGNRVGLYGYGWDDPKSPETHVCARQWVGQTEESGVYAAARAAVVMSNHVNLRRYASDRLFRALLSGAVALVEYVDDYEGLGLDDGVNCRFWRSEDDLYRLIDEVLAGGRAGETPGIRAAAHALAFKYHRWDARMGELLAVVDAVRGDR